MSYLASPHDSNSPTKTRAAAPELLAPAGDFDCVRAAVENGADAVYFGLEAGFNARARAANFALEDLSRVLEFLHGRGVCGYVTLNTLVFPSELTQFEQTVRHVAAAGADAVLVQDLGAVRLIRAVCPDLPVHASTQMTLSSAESIRLVERLGVERVVLARELSVDEIRRIRRGTTMPLEAFVHGALCVAYSGQCMTSESLGGRSANRGQCAQACRLPYELVCDGRDVDLGDQQYLLSPQDLAAFDLVPQLIEAGVCSFKIEGRLKSPEYVANITRHYRQAIDRALAGQPVAFTPRDVEEMELSFSRGFSHGWLQGCDHKMLVPALSSAKHGVPVGRVRRIRDCRVEVELTGSLARGDGLVFEGNRAQGTEQGGRVFEIFRSGHSLTERISSGTVELAFGRGAIDLAALYPGQQLWKTDEPQLTARLQKTFRGEQPRRRLPLALTIHAAVGRPLQVEARVLADSGVGQRSAAIACRVQSPEPLVEAIRHPLTAELLQEQFGRLGGTAYELRTLEAHIEGRPMLRLSVLGKLRHALVDALNSQAVLIPSRRIAQDSVLDELRPSRRAGDERLASTTEPRLHVLCRSLGQLEAALAAEARSVLVDFQDIRQYRPAVKLAHDAGAEILLATPRIQKPLEMGIFRALARHAPDGVLVRNLAGLDYFVAAGVPVIADFSLNVTNELSARYVRELGARRMTASYDLNRDQLLDLVSAVPVDWLEVVIHQHMPMFHMEHCVFCAVLSPGTNKTNCGRPCDVHEVKLRDRIGMEHPLKADVGCRNTLYNAVPQSAAEVVPTLLARGVQHFRVELLEEAAAEPIGEIISLYRDLLAGRLPGQQVWMRLKASNRVGVTRGTLEERRNPLAIL